MIGVVCVTPSTIVCPQSKDVSYMNAKERSDVDPEVRYNIKFKQAINYTVSSVHIPVEIYKGGSLAISPSNYLSGTVIILMFISIPELFK